MINPFIPIVLLAAALGSSVVILLHWRRTAKRTLARADTAEKAYAELRSQSAIRERSLMAERDDFRSAALLRQQHWVRLESAEASADRLAPIVEQFIKDIDDTARLLNDDKPPALTAEREAIRLHREILNSRHQ